MGQRRWVVAGRRLPEPGAAVVVQVVDGQVVVDVPRGPAPLDPADVERLRQALTEARALALWQLGGWGPAAGTGPTWPRRRRRSPGPDQ